MSNGSEKFAKLLEESFKKRKSLEPGTKYKSKITSVREDYVFISIQEENIKGIVSLEEFILDEKKPIAGTELSVFFLREKHGDYYFTSTLTGNDINSDNLEIALEREIPVWGHVGTEINGGYEIRIGEFTAFCPFSQIDFDKKGKNLTGSQFKFILNEINTKSKKIIVSQKKISDREKEFKKEILQAELKEGNYVTCTIKSIHNFGLIVDMNGLDALVPVSESSFKKNVDLNKEFNIGQVVRGKVLNLDWKNNKFSLSLKDSIDDPWSKTIPFKEGDIVSASVDSIKPFGMFVKFNDHFHGLVPSKETGLPLRVPISTHFKVGDAMDVFIMEINPEKRQISASISKAEQSREQLEYQSYISDQTSSNESSFGLLLKKSLKKK